MIYVTKLLLFLRLCHCNYKSRHFNLLVFDCCIGVPQKNNNIKLCRFEGKIVSVFLITGNITKACQSLQSPFECLSSFISHILDFVYYTESISIFDGETVITVPQELEDE